MRVLFAALVLAFILGTTCAQESVSDKQVSDGYDTIHQLGKKHDLSAIRVKKDGTYEGKRRGDGQVMQVDIPLDPHVLAEIKRRDARRIEDQSKLQADPLQPPSKDYLIAVCIPTMCQFESDICSRLMYCSTCWGSSPTNPGTCV
jgi:hypothetical protein